MKNQISLNPALIILVLTTAAFFVVLASVAGQLVPYFTERNEAIVLLNVDSEQNIPTFFSVLLVLFAALLLAVIAILNSEQRAPHTLYWAILSCGFLFMAVDEATSIHEKLNEPIGLLLGSERLNIFYFAWIVPGIAFVLVIGIFFLRFLFHLPAKTRFFFLIAANLYLGGVIGVEFIGNHYAKVNGTESLAYVMSATIEESLEMAGIIVFIFALLTYITDTYKEVRFRFDDSVENFHDRRFPEWPNKAADIRLNIGSTVSPSTPVRTIAQSGRSNHSSRYTGDR